jgi:hypothetical protein
MPVKTDHGPADGTFSGDFTRVFPDSPIRPVEPNGHHLEWELIGIVSYDDGVRSIRVVAVRACPGQRTTRP